ncbi:MAG: CBS domain-containing protein [Spongiibacteraceae bacterium]
MSTLLAGELMQKPALSVTCDMSLGDAVETLFKHRVTGLPVTNANHEVVGFLSEQDCIHAMLVSSYHCEGLPSVKDVMRSEVLSVTPDVSIVDIAQNMGRDKPKVYPVVDDGVLVGVITRSIVLRALWENRSSCDVPNSARKEA